MQSFKLRPHHGLCIRFFENKGYSDSFTGNMAEVIRFLAEEDPEIVITMGADCICSPCPELSAGRCSLSGMAAGYDEKVVEICGLTYGQSIRWSKFQETVRECITDAGRLFEVCGDCRWYGICGNK